MCVFGGGGGAGGCSAVVCARARWRRVRVSVLGVSHAHARPPAHASGGQLVKDELGISLDKADESVLGVAAKVSVSKEHITIVGDGSTQAEVEARVKQARGWAAWSCDTLGVGTRNAHAGSQTRRRARRSVRMQGRTLTGHARTRLP